MFNFSKTENVGGMPLIFDTGTGLFKLVPSIFGGGGQNFSKMVNGVNVIQKSYPQISLVKNILIVAVVAS